MHLIGFTSIEDIENQYDAPNCLKGANVIYAYYCYEDYSGSSIVIYSYDGKLYEVNGSHCSCYGLEGQWNPEETTFDFIENRFFSEGSDSYVFRESDEALTALKQVLFSYAVDNIIVGDSRV